MQVTQTSQDGLKHEFRIVVGADEIEEKVGARIDQLRREARLPGFRPGKVPAQLLRKRYGKAVIGEVLEDAVRAGAERALREKELRPALQPNFDVSEYSEGKDLEYKLSVEVLPDIELPDFSALKLERLVAKIADAEVEQAIKDIAASQKSFAAAEAGHSAETGDALIIDFVGRVDGEEFEGGKAEAHQLVLGSNSFVGTFEDQLIGIKVGENRTVKLTFPDAYVNDKLAGKAAEFDVTVQEVRRPVVPAVDDDFAKGLGLESLDTLRKAMRERIEREHGSVSRRRLKRALLDALSEGNDFAVPLGMVDMEFDSIWHQLEHDMEHAGETFESAGRDEQEVREDYRRIAERRVRLGLLLAEAGRRNNIQVTDDELKRAMMEQARSMPGQERALFEFYQKNPQMAEQLRAPIFEDKVVDFVLEMADVSNRTVSVEELMREPEPDADGAVGDMAGAAAKRPKRGKMKSAKTQSGAKKSDGADVASEN